jgi:hypothetical protein
MGSYRIRRRDNQWVAAMITVSALAFDPATGKWTKPVEYKARNRTEALNWAKFNRDWMIDIRLEGDGFSVPVVS